MSQSAAVSISPTPNKTSTGSKDIDLSSIVSSKLRSNKQNQEAGKTTTTEAASANPNPQIQSSPADVSQAVESTPARMTRQRTAHLAHLDEAALHKDEDSPLPTPASAASPSAEPVSQICLCQPDPKIPRPRNAFILYRQHHQQNITTQNERLSNPEISKIAGELWRGEPENIKDEWRALAGEEKARHAQQYPEYRFQPRHKNKGSPTSAPGEKARCHKCRGQSIASNTSPFTTPLNTPTSALKIKLIGGSLSGPPSPNTTRAPGKTTDKQLEMINTSHRPDARYSGSPSTRRFPEDPMDMPDRKRLRYETHPPSMPTSAQQPPRPILTNGQSTSDSRYPYPSPRAADHRRVSLPPPPERPYHTSRGSVSYNPDSPPPNTPQSSLMGPPPPRANITSRSGLHAYPATPATAHPHGNLYSSRSRTDSESLRLAPLLSPGAPDQSRSVEAMVMSIPVIGKVTLLRRIAPPIKDPSPASPSPRIRGSIIAVEGDESDAAENMLRQLESFLKRNDEFDVKVLPGPELPGPKPAIKDFIEVVAKWHDKTSEMIDFVTGVEYQRTEENRMKEIGVERKQSHASVAELEDTDMEEGEVLEGERKDSHDAKRSRVRELEKKKAEMTASIERESRRQSVAQENASKIPLLLVSNYILNACDKWASMLPINDVYSPADHWTWTATLWRGIIGADLTVYVRNMDKEIQETQSAGSVGPEPVHAKPVEMKDDVGAIFVKREKGKVDDGAVRRVAFEVGEWVRMQAGKHL